MRGRLVSNGNKQHVCHRPVFWFTTVYKGAVWECPCGQQWLLSGGYDGLSWRKVVKPVLYPPQRIEWP